MGPVLVVLLAKLPRVANSAIKLKIGKHVSISSHKYQVPALKSVLELHNVINGSRHERGAEPGAVIAVAVFFDAGDPGLGYGVKLSLYGIWLVLEFSQGLIKLLRPLGCY